MLDRPAVRSYRRGSVAAGAAACAVGPARSDGAPRLRRDRVRDRARERRARDSAPRRGRPRLRSPRTRGSPCPSADPLPLRSSVSAASGRRDARMKRARRATVRRQSPPMGDGRAVLSRHRSRGRGVGERPDDRERPAASPSAVRTRAASCLRVAGQRCVEQDGLGERAEHRLVTRTRQPARALARFVVVPPGDPGVRIERGQANTGRARAAASHRASDAPAAEERGDGFGGPQAASAPPPQQAATASRRATRSRRSATRCRRTAALPAPPPQSASASPDARRWRTPPRRRMSSMTSRASPASGYGAAPVSPSATMWPPRVLISTASMHEHAVRGRPADRARASRRRGR